MGRNTKPITQKVMARILETAGAPRVSKEAAEALAELVEEKAKEISSLASKNAKHAGRNTILESDIKLAIGR